MCALGFIYQRLAACRANCCRRMAFIRQPINEWASCRPFRVKRWPPGRSGGQRDVKKGMADDHPRWGGAHSRRCPMGKNRLAEKEKRPERDAGLAGQMQLHHADHHIDFLLRSLPRFPRSLSSALPPRVGCVSFSSVCRTLHWRSVCRLFPSRKLARRCHRPSHSQATPSF